MRAQVQFISAIAALISFILAAVYFSFIYMALFMAIISIIFGYKANQAEKKKHNL